MAIVPDNECRMPTLIGPLSSAGAAAAGAAGAAGAAEGAGSGGFWHPMTVLNEPAINNPQNDFRIFNLPFACLFFEAMNPVSQPIFNKAA
jgi:hypothetical protein